MIKYLKWMWLNTSIKGAFIPMFWFVVQIAFIVIILVHSKDYPYALIALIAPLYMIWYNYMKYKATK